MIKSQDIFITIRAGSCCPMTYQEQDQRCEDFYRRTSKAVLVKHYTLFSGNYVKKAQEIKDMLKLGPFRLVLVSKNLIARNMSLLKLFKDAKSIHTLDGPIERIWIEAKLKRLKSRPPSPRPAIRKSKKLSRIDQFGLPLLIPYEKRLLDWKALRECRKEEKKKMKEKIARTKELSERKAMLEKKKDRYRAGDYKEFYDIITWYAPAEKILTSTRMFNKACAFYSKMKGRNVSLSTKWTKERIVLYNTENIPKDIAPPFRKAKALDKEFVYALEGKRLRRKI